MRTDEAALRREVHRIYSEVNRFADETGGIEYGLNVLYGPPILNPTVMVVSIQGGGKDGCRQRTWPDRLQYLNSAYGFGQRLECDFVGAGLAEVLKTATVATNVVFPQWPAFEDWQRQPSAAAWLGRSRKWLSALVDAMSPRVILTYGKPAFCAARRVCGLGEQRANARLGRQDAFPPRAVSANGNSSTQREGAPRRAGRLPLKAPKRQGRKCPVSFRLRMLRSPVEAQRKRLMLP